MNLNATLFGQIVTFVLLILFTMKFIWPPMVRALQERRKRIADGLEAAERGQASLQTARHEAAKILHEAKIEAGHILEQAHLKETHLVEEARNYGRHESHRLIMQAQKEIAQDVSQAKTSLKDQMADLVIGAAEKVLEREVDKAAHEKLLKELMAQL